MKSTIVYKDIEQFNQEITTLGRIIGNLSLSWKDSKYQEFRESLTRILSLYKDVILKGEQFCKRIDQFDKEMEREV